MKTRNMERYFSLKVKVDGKYFDISRIFRSLSLKIEKYQKNPRKINVFIKDLNFNQHITDDNGDKALDPDIWEEISSSLSHHS